MILQKGMVFGSHRVERIDLLPWPGRTALLLDTKTQKPALLHLLPYDDFPWISGAVWQDITQTLKQGLLLSHPNLLQLSEVSQPLPQSLGVWSAWPFSEDSNVLHLRDLLNERPDRRLSEAEALRFFEPLLQAFEILQAHHMPPRLVFPEAILLDPSDRTSASSLRLGMLGLSKLFSPPDWSKIPGPPLWWGYLSPRLREEPTLADLFFHQRHTLGAILWEMVVGRVPPPAPMEPPSAPQGTPPLALSSWFESFLLRFFASSSQPFASFSAIRTALQERISAILTPSSARILPLTLSYAQIELPDSLRKTLPESFPLAALQVSAPPDPSRLGLSSLPSPPAAPPSGEEAPEVVVKEEIRGTLEQPWGNRYQRRISIPSMLFEDHSVAREERAALELPQRLASFLEEKAASNASLETLPTSSPLPPADGRPQERPLPLPIPQAWEEDALRQLQPPNTPSLRAGLLAAGILIALAIGLWRACAP